MEEESNTNNIIVEPPRQDRNSMFGFFTRPNYAYTNLPGDVLMNPYVPPLRDERYLMPEVIMPPPGRVPINVSTNIGAVDTNYRQVGILTPLNGNNSKILPLMGRPLFVNRDKWQYYTISNSGNLNTKLPVSVNGKSCTSEYGCNEIMNGDMVYVEGYGNTFKATIYENNMFSYIPYL